MSRQTTVARVEEIVGRIGAPQGLEVVEVELKGTGRNQLLRIYIDKPGGVTHSDCERVSSEVGDLLETDADFPGHYTLEVSSPGVERKLKKPGDFERFQGQKARVVMRESGVLEAQSAHPAAKHRFVDGTLAGVDESGILLDIEGGDRLRIPYSAIDRANLKFEW